MAKRLVMVPLFLGVIGTAAALTIDWEDVALLGTANETVDKVFEKTSDSANDVNYTWEGNSQPEELAMFLPVSITDITVCIDPTTNDTTMTVQLDGLPTGTTPGVNDDYYIIVKVPKEGGGTVDIQSAVFVTAGPTGTAIIDVDAQTPDGALVSGDAQLVKVVQDPDDSDGVMGPCPCVIANSSALFAFTVLETIPPTITCPSNITVPNSTGLC
ncbi:MAG: hypothetical protein ACE5FF_12885, partial [Saprospiraceae bacterium]